MARVKNFHGSESSCGRSRYVRMLLVSFLLFTDLSLAEWVDPDTPMASRTTQALSEGDDRQYELRFSDEFEQDGRTFHDGNDPRWTAENKNDYTNSALHYYSHDNAFTSNGVLNITTEQKVNTYKAFDEKKKVFYADKKHVQTALLQGWNKFCFIGGIIEFSAKLPGDPKIGGLWPALWMLGNLARATYVGSSDFVWPFSYNKCDPRTRKSQLINACSRVNHYGLDALEGRGSPEIDVIEAMQGDPGKLPHTHIERPYQSASLQIAPGIEIDRPVLGSRPHKFHWYPFLEYGNETNSDLNPFFYGVTLVHKPRSRTYQSDALSANMNLNNTHYQQQHIYRVEWEPPAANGTGGYIRWFTDGKLVYGLSGESLGIMGTEIPSEPMYMIMNTAVASHWGFPAPCPDNCQCDCFECGNPDCTCGLPADYCENFPASFEIDYVRVYQAVNESSHMLGCSPKHRPTATYIKGNPKKFTIEGQKKPLQPVRSGGGPCASVKDCGGAKRGSCLSHAACGCFKGWTGPNCLAHAGFYDLDTSKPTPKFSLSNIIFPRSLIVVIAVLVLGFLVSLCGAIRLKTKESKQYQKLNEAVATNETTNAAYAATATDSSPSYQLGANPNYALPTPEKVVTYCVIDGRLVDS